MCSCGWSPLCDALGGEQRVKRAGPVERVQLVGAADVRCADEYLRHRHAAAGALDHLAAPLWIAADIDLHECNPLAGEQRLGGMAIAAIAGGIDFDLGHRCEYRQFRCYSAG